MAFCNGMNHTASAEGFSMTAEQYDRIINEPMTE